MSERTCSIRECMKKYSARGLCSTHYARAYKAGTLPPRQLKLSLEPLHKITDADVERGVGTCSACGPDTPIRVRDRRGHECKIRRHQDSKRYQQAKGPRRHILKQYNLTLRDYERIRLAQGGRCRICDEVAESLVVDHDHACCPDRKKSCGKCIRGLLCRHCNLAIGYLRDKPEAAMAAAEYLRQR